MIITTEVKQNAFWGPTVRVSYKNHYLEATVNSYESKEAAILDLTKRILDGIDDKKDSEVMTLKWCISPEEYNAIKGENLVKKTI